jgi:hypothetical protein
MARALSAALLALATVSTHAAVSSAAAPPLPPLAPLLRWNATLLAFSKARVAANDSQLMPAFNALIANANAALTAGE